MRTRSRTSKFCAYGAKSFEPGGCTLTNASGAYALSDVPAGIYLVEFWAVPTLNYLAQFYDGAERSADADYVFVNDGATVGGIDAEMRSGGSFSGEVTDALTDEALADIEVCAWTLTTETYRCTVTDTEGEYRLVGLRNGLYAVAFWDEEEGSSAYLTQYYDHKSIEAEATAIPLIAGQSFADIDAALQRGASITGRITDSEGGPVGWTSVCAQTLFQVYADCDYSNSAGEYELGELGPGAYKVGFSADDEGEDAFAARFYDEKSSFGLADQVILAEGGVASGINGRLERIVRKSTSTTTQPSSASRPAAKAKRRKCKKGYRRKLVRGKRRCARVLAHGHRRHGKKVAAA